MNLGMGSNLSSQNFHGQLNKNRIKVELDFLLNDNKKILTDYDKLSDLLNKKGASKNAAQFIIKSI
jgi:lipid A disaccharide synthetase